MGRSDEKAYVLIRINGTRHVASVLDHLLICAISMTVVKQVAYVNDWRMPDIIKDAGAFLFDVQ